MLCEIKLECKVNVNMYVCTYVSEGSGNGFSSTHVIGANMPMSESTPSIWVRAGSYFIFFAKVSSTKTAASMIV